MFDKIILVVAIILTVGWGFGFLTRNEFKTNTNLRIIIHWIMALGFFLVHSVPGIHLIYTFPVGVILSFAGIAFGVRMKPMTVLIISAVIWSFVLMGISDYFGTFA